MAAAWSVRRWLAAWLAAAAWSAGSAGMLHAASTRAPRASTRGPQVVASIGQHGSASAMGGASSWRLAGRRAGLARTVRAPRGRGAPPRAGASSCLHRRSPSSTKNFLNWQNRQFGFCRVSAHSAHWPNQFTDSAKTLFAVKGRSQPGYSGVLARAPGGIETTLTPTRYPGFLLVLLYVRDLDFWIRAREKGRKTDN